MTSTGNRPRTIHTPPSSSSPSSAPPTSTSPFQIEELKTEPGLATIQQDAQHYQRAITTLLEQRRLQNLEPKLDVQRVNQLDAEQLDKELNMMLAHQFKKIFKYFRPDLLTTFKPELDAFLHALIFRFSIYMDVATPGNILQNLCYTDAHADAIDLPGATVSADIISRRISQPTSKQMGTSHLHRLSSKQKWMYFLLAIGGRWGWARLQQHMTIDAWGSYPPDSYQYRIYRICRYLDHTYAITSIVNFIVFLINGRYRSLIERILCMRLVYIRSRVARQVSYEFMNQQLVWHGFSEFLFFLLPLINFDRIRSLVHRFISWGNDNPVAEGCPVCHTAPACTPYVSSCGHIFCYYCLRGWLLHDVNYSCPICSQHVHSMEPYSVDKHAPLEGGHRNNDGMG